MQTPPKKPWSNTAPNGGRPPELTEKHIEIICNALRIGIYPETAYQLAGLSTWQVKHAIIKAIEQPESIYAALVSAMNKAIAEAELRDLYQIDLAAQGRQATFLKGKDGNIVYDKTGKPVYEALPVYPDWRAAAWKLERRFKSRWMQQVRLEADPLAEFNERQANPEPQEKETTKALVSSEVKELARNVLLEDPDAE